jgi:hypothetical protein
MERDHLAKKLEIDTKDFYDKKKAFQDEIERLKQQVASLEESRKLLEEGLEEQRRANLDSARKNPQAASDRATEKELILLDRAQKAEKQEEEMRNERLIAIDQQKKLKDQLMEKELLLSKKDLEITHLKFAPQKNIAHEK